MRTLESELNYLTSKNESKLDGTSIKVEKFCTSLTVSKNASTSIEEMVDSFQTDSLSRALKQVNSMDEIQYVVYDSELSLPAMTALIEADLSEPYTVYTYRFFLHQWPHLSFLVHYL